MPTELKPLLRRVEVSAVVFIVLSIISLIIFALAPFDIDLLKYLSLGLSLSLIVFLVYPYFRGIKKGDYLIANVVREIETPIYLDSYVAEIPVTALKNGKKGSIITVRLPDGTYATARIENYGFIDLPEVQLIEVEISQEESEITH